MKVLIIKECPVCSSTLERVKDQLFCRNVVCDATNSKRILHFAKSMKIKGLGEKTVEKLGIEDITEIYQLPLTLLTEVMGDTIGKKIHTEINNSKCTTLERLLPAFSIPLIGITAARKLNVLCSSIENINAAKCKKVGLGDIATTNLMAWINNVYPKYKDLPLLLKEIKNKPKESINIKVCITGKLDNYKSRALAQTYLESLGITVTSGVSKTLDFLICEDNKPSSKVSKADMLGIQILTITKLIEELKL